MELYLFSGTFVFVWGGGENSVAQPGSSLLHLVPPSSPAPPAQPSRSATTFQRPPQILLTLPPWPPGTPLFVPCICVCPLYLPHIWCVTRIAGLRPGCSSFPSQSLHIDGGRGWGRHGQGARLSFVNLAGELWWWFLDLRGDEWYKISEIVTSIFYLRAAF